MCISVIKLLHFEFQTSLHRCHATIFSAIIFLILNFSLFKDNFSNSLCFPKCFPKFFNSLTVCFRCLELLFTIFPVFPVEWEPCPIFLLLHFLNTLVKINSYWIVDDVDGLKYIIWGKFKFFLPKIQRFILSLLIAHSWFQRANIC